MQKYPVLAFLAACILLNPVSADPQRLENKTSFDDSIETDDQNFFDLSLESLAEIEIITSSRKKEKVADSAAIVSVLTREDFDRLGVNDLYEAISYLPGVTLTETYYGYTAINIRGVLQPHYNNKVLIMINNHPTFETVNGSSHLEFVPLHMVERIEVIRGPGSALYGTNALAGVINIITRDEDSISGTEIYGQYGSNDKVKTELVTQTGPLLIAASVQKDNGYDYQGTLDETGTAVDLDYQNDLANLFVNFHQGDFNFDLGYFQQEKMKMGVVPVVRQQGTHDFSAYYFNAKHNWSLNDGVLSVRVRHNYNQRKTDAGWLTDPFTPGRDNYYSYLLTESTTWAGDINYSKAFNSELDYILGLELEYDESKPYEARFEDNDEFNQLTPYFDTYNTTNASVFTQWQWQATDDLSFIFGARLNHNEDADLSPLVPRLGAVYSITEQTSLKLLYGEAFRNPDHFERYSDSAVILGDQDLDRERIKTFDIGLDSQWQKTQLRLNAYYQTLIDSIRRVPPMNGNSPYYENSEDQEVWGLEGEINSILCHHLKGFANFSLKDGEVDGEEMDYIANINGNLGLNYKIDKHWSTAGNVQYVGKKDYETISGEQGEISDYVLINHHLSYHRDNYKITAKVKNLFDEEYQYPEYIRRNIESTPGGPGRSYYLEGALFF